MFPPTPPALPPGAPAPQTTTSGVLVIGPAGVGKTTLGLILSGKLNPLFEGGGRYQESIDLERVPLSDDPQVEVVVAPGQPHRRNPSWERLLKDVADGRFSGVILLAAYGYHNHELGAMKSYKDHHLYDGDKNRFLDAFLADRRAEEVNVLNHLLPSFSPPSGKKFWLLTLVTKQDLWWDDRADVEKHYLQGDYGGAVQRLQSKLGVTVFRHELALLSLIISNFKTGKDEVLAKNTAGYDMAAHFSSTKEFLGKLDSLRKWQGEA